MYADLLLVYRAMLCCCWIQTTVPFADFCSRQMIRSLRRERLGGAARRRRWGVTPASIILFLLEIKTQYWKNCSRIVLLLLFVGAQALNCLHFCMFKCLRWKTALLWSSDIKDINKSYCLWICIFKNSLFGTRAGNNRTFCYKGLCPK